MPERTLRRGGRGRQPGVELLADALADVVEVAVEVALDAGDLVVERGVELLARADQQERRPAEREGSGDQAGEEERGPQAAGEAAAAPGAVRGAREGQRA